MRALEDSIVRLLKQKPFYGQFLLQCRRKILHSSAPAGVTFTSGIPTLAINPESFDLFSAPEQQALLEHMVKHLLHLHPGRRRERHPRTWDLACDLAINGSIDNLPPESPLPARLRMPDQLSAEEYYDRLPQIALLGSLQASGDGEGDGPPLDQQTTHPIDDHDIWQDADSTPQLLSEQVVRQMVQTAFKKCHHEIPGDLERIIQPYLKPPAIAWQQILRQFVGCAGRVGKRSTWKRTHRRFGHLTPGTRKKQRLNLLVAVDISDSTDQQTLREKFAAELVHIARGRESRLTVLYCGSRIQKIESLSSSKMSFEVYRGGGYTDLRPAFEYAKEMTPPPAAMIYLTDGYGPVPERTELSTLWVLSPGGEKPAPWGVALHLDTLEAS